MGCCLAPGRRSGRARQALPVLPVLPVLPAQYASRGMGQM